MNEVSKSLDNFILDKDEPFWYVELNNGEMVYQDENRSGMIPDAWNRLQSYCRVNSLWIVKMWIRFRSNIVEIPPNKDAYWFKKGIMGGFCKDTRRRFSDINFFIIGYPEDDTLKVTKWRIPELVDWETEDRKIPDKDIIWKNGSRKN